MRIFREHVILLTYLADYERIAEKKFAKVVKEQGGCGGGLSHLEQQK